MSSPIVRHTAEKCETLGPSSDVEDLSKRELEDASDQAGT